jgi:ribosomal protein S18 acetylase RimI-like enzyme
MNVRGELRPGDLGAILAHHGRLYGREYGLDGRFEAMVAESIAQAAERGFPREREGIWIVEDAGEHAGSLALTDEGDEATIRWVVLDPAMRGRGLGRRLVGEAIELATQAGFARVALTTFSELTTAARIYREHGFEVVWEDTRPRWGRDAITYQRYELDLANRSLIEKGMGELLGIERA